MPSIFAPGAKGRPAPPVLSQDIEPEWCSRLRPQKKPSPHVKLAHAASSLGDSDLLRVTPKGLASDVDDFDFSLHEGLQSISTLMFLRLAPEQQPFGINTRTAPTPQQVICNIGPPLANHMQHIITQHTMGLGLGINPWLNAAALGSLWATFPKLAWLVVPIAVAFAPRLGFGVRKTIRLNRTLGPKDCQQLARSSISWGTKLFALLGMSYLSPTAVAVDLHATKLFELLKAPGDSVHISHVAKERAGFGVALGLLILLGPDFDWQRYRQLTIRRDDHNTVVVKVRSQGRQRWHATLFDGLLYGSGQWGQGHRSQIQKMQRIDLATSTGLLRYQQLLDLFVSGAQALQPPANLEHVEYDEDVTVRGLSWRLPALMAWLEGLGVGQTTQRAHARTLHFAGAVTPLTWEQSAWGSEQRVGHSIKHWHVHLCVHRNGEVTWRLNVLMPFGSSQDQILLFDDLSTLLMRSPPAEAATFRPQARTNLHFSCSGTFHPTGLSAEATMMHYGGPHLGPKIIKKFVSLSQSQRRPINVSLCDGGLNQMMAQERLSRLAYPKSTSLWPWTSAHKTHQGLVDGLRKQHENLAQDVFFKSLDPVYTSKTLTVLKEAFLPLQATSTPA